MDSPSIGQRKTGSLMWPAAFLGSGGAAGLWLGVVHGSVLVLLAVVAVAWTALLGAAWLRRDRAARRLNAALETYAERELARTRRRKGPHAA